MTYYTINMDYFSSCSGEHNVFTSRKFTNRDEAREAMEFMQEMGFHKSVNSDVFANYNIVTYTRYGDVVHSTSYNSECYESSATSSDKKLSVSGTSIVPHRVRVKVHRKPRRRFYASDSTVRRSRRLAKTSPPPSPPSPPSSETVNEINVSNGRHYEAYGKGYLLFPSGEDDPDYGEKYFHEGFWNAKQNAWFFRGRHLDIVKELCNHKTLHHNTKTAEVSIKNDAVSAEETLGNLIAQTADGLVQLREYKQGVLLTVPKTYFKYGNPWFYTDEELGKWLNSESGWFFSRSMLPKLRECTFPWLRDLSGSWCARTKTAKIIEEDRKAHSERMKKYYQKHPEARKVHSERMKKYYQEHSEASTSSTRPRRSSRRFVARERKNGRTFEHYGKGFILRPANEDDPDWGEKYYRGGWWMPSQNGWFFKKKSDLEFTV